VKIRPDDDVRNADWTKHTWDIPAQNVEELNAYLDQRGMTVAGFKALPVYEMNRDRLAWLAQLDSDVLRAEAESTGPTQSRDEG
jgi:hypothetical protein